MKEPTEPCSACGMTLWVPLMSEADSQGEFLLFLHGAALTSIFCDAVARVYQTDSVATMPTLYDTFLMMMEKGQLHL